MSNSGEHDQKPVKSASVAPAKRSWSPPRVIDHGSIRHLVRAATGTILDKTGISMKPAQ